MKVLLIRLAGLGDVASILVPAVKIMKQRDPGGQVDVLTYGPGIELMELQEEVTAVLTVTPEQWPNDLLPAMASFTEIAQAVVAQQYDLVVNLDTWFMPCFLARTLKDALLPVQGNFIDYTVHALMDKLSVGQLSHAYFEKNRYLVSSFPNMKDWSTPWWDRFNGAGSYPEFYLHHCCGLDGPIDISLPLPADEAFRASADGREIVALSTAGSKPGKRYPKTDELRGLLERAGYFVWSQFDGSLPMRTTLERLKATDLLITVATSTQWLARLVGCPSLLIPGAMPPTAMGAEITVARVTDCQYCADTTCSAGRNFACMSVAPWNILDLAAQALRTRPSVRE